jgi:hypothetical protein
MTKRIYTKPILNYESFLPSEYVAVCWGVGCNVSTSNEYEQTHGPSYNKNWYDMGVSHAQEHCGTSSNQVIYDDNNDGTADRMVEEGTDGLGNLTCTIYTDGNFTTTKSITTIKPGDDIYWTTNAGDKIWHHRGNVQATFPGRPNHS